MTSFIDRLKSNMTGMNKGRYFPRPKGKEKERNVIYTNRWDDAVWKQARATDFIDSFIGDLTIGDQHRGGTRPPFDPSPELVHDLFMAFYKAAPQIREKRAVNKESHPVHKIITEMIDNPRLAELQDITAGDPTMSLVAVKAISETVTEIIGRIPPPPQPGGEGEPGDGDGEPSEGKGKSKGKGKADGDSGDPGDPGGEGEDDGGEGEGDDFEADSENALEQEEADWKDAWDKLMEEEGIDIERAMNRALDKANEETDELEEARRGIGLTDGEWRQMSPEQRLELAAKLRTPQMKALAQVIGRMKRFALGVKATRVTDVPHEAFDVETGNDIKRLLRSEFALLGTPETTYEFYRRYADKELLQFKMRGREEVGKGPIVICIDKSGSMHGDPFTWAMAVSEALRRFAAEEERDYYAIFFGFDNDRTRFDFPKGTGPFEKVLAFLSCEANGGTAFAGVLTEALEKASKSFDGDGKGKADIVFITDGQAHLDDQWIQNFNEERGRVGVRVYSVYIGGAYDMSHQNGPVSLLERISDAVIPVRELRPEAVEHIFQKV